MQVDLGIVVSLVTAAATLGAALSRLGALSERTKALEGFRDRIASRVERLEVRTKLRRALTAPPGSLQAVPRVLDDEGSSDEHG